MTSKQRKGAFSVVAMGLMLVGLAVLAGCEAQLPTGPADAESGAQSSAQAERCILMHGQIYCW